MKFLTSLLALSTLLPLVLAGVPPAHAIKLSPSAGTLISTCAKPGVIALTFDDGPGVDMNKLITILNRAGAKATFFVTGTLYGCIYDRKHYVQRAFREGHQIASHTWTHPNLADLTTEQVDEEMLKLEKALKDILGVKPTYMRAPYLSTGGSTVEVMTRRGYRIVQCDVDSQDWNALTPEQSLARFEAAGATGLGHIPLMHETVATTPEGLAPLVIEWAKKNKLKMVTVAECLGDKHPYVKADKYLKRKPQNTC